MTLKLSLYRLIEAVIGRQLAWRIGRFLYLGARRELLNDPHHNGEYMLIGWALDAAPRMSGRSLTGPVTLLDVGANIGDWTGAAMAAFGARGLAGRARVHAFEPAPVQHSRLLGRFREAIAAKTLSVHALAVGAVAERVRFEVTGAASGTNAIAIGPASIDSPAKSTSLIEVEVETIDQIADTSGIDGILLLKIDTEGNDLNVISGARRMLDEQRIAIIQFEYNWRWLAFGHCLKMVFDIMARRNYAFGALTQDGIEVHAAWHPELDRYIETNYVLVRRDVLALLPHRWMVFADSNTIQLA